MTTTLNKIRAFQPCSEGWTKLLNNLGKSSADDEPLPFSRILTSNGIADAIWALRTLEGEDRKLIGHFAIACAREVLPIWEKAYPDDPRPRSALDTAERYLSREATRQEFDAARRAADADADAVSWAAAAVSWAATAARWAADADAAADAASWAVVAAAGAGAAAKRVAIFLRLFGE